MPNRLLVDSTIRKDDDKSLLQTYDDTYHKSPVSEFDTSKDHQYQSYVHTNHEPVRESYVNTEKNTEKHYFDYNNNRQPY